MYVGACGCMYLATFNTYKEAKESNKTEILSP